MINLARFCILPILVFLYILAGISLVFMTFLFKITKFFDWLFDKVCLLVKYDNRYWPLPRASDEIMVMGESHEDEVYEKAGFIVFRKQSFIPLDKVLS